ncbi:outer membrane beta-barrel protein [Fibrivirga algicola]|uniref:Porin family protein n=1 Tax=Fibrivirga algicola TaxID=2950420 RepID=A0ABX0QMV5_9BACT|nr:outer membrane beta-barrel protein [Fibrivirga algicola]ARK11531.1 hypothetical protein A6C57_15030 [Fibrella sp. ES10-3-2-2]NID12606.1 porin family protein [Fibrivirga algicola]
MKATYLLIAFSCLTTQLVLAQSTPKRSFMIGPTVGVNKTSYVDEDIHLNYTQIHIPTSAYGGLDASYQVNRWLVGAKLLYQRQTLQASFLASDYYIDITNPDPNRVFRFDSEYHLITAPLSIGYRLAPNSRLQWYVGGGIAFEYRAQTGKRTTFTSAGSTTTTDTGIVAPRVELGYGVQTTLRYAVTPQVTFQLEPAVRYNPAGNYQIRDSYQYRGAFAVLVSL